jgi:hypothetical protein
MNKNNVSYYIGELRNEINNCHSKKYTKLTELIQKLEEEIFK